MDVTQGRGISPLGQVIQQFGRPDLQGCRQLADRVQAGALPSPLQNADVIPVKPGHLGKLFLRKAAFEAQFAQPFSKQNPGTRFSHTCNVKTCTR